MLMSRSTLDMFMQVYDPRLVGWGIDAWLMHELGGDLPHRVAIIDAVPCVNPDESLEGRLRAIDTLQPTSARKRQWEIVRQQRGIPDNVNRQQMLGAIRPASVEDWWALVEGQFKLIGASFKLWFRRLVLRKPDQAYALRRRIRAASRELHRCVPHEQTIVFVDDDQIGNLGGDHKWIPFLERNGVYWGAPEDDDAARGELERLRTAGAEFLVLAWPAFWWLDAYAGFFSSIYERYRLVQRGELLVIFDLRPR